MAKYTRVPIDTFKNLVLNAGVIATNFNPETGEVKEEDLIGATNGGISFNATTEFVDRGDGIDNMPLNMKELKEIDYITAVMSGTFVTLKTKAAKLLMAAAKEEGGKLTPINHLVEDSFNTIWMIADYSDVNNDGEEEGKAGFVAIELLNALSTGGFQIQTQNKDKGQFAFEFTGHYSLDAQDTVPYNVYIKEGTEDGE